MRADIFGRFESTSVKFEARIDTNLDRSYVKGHQVGFVRLMDGN